jgi:nicotinamidase-related amidase
VFFIASSEQIKADSYYRGFKIVVPVDSVAAISEESQQWGLKQMEALFRAKIER